MKEDLNAVGNELNYYEVACKKFDNCPDCIC